MFGTKTEQQFLLNNAKDTLVSLEWGSGDSTIEIGKKVKKLISIEHNKKWYNKISRKIKNNKLNNTSLYHIPGEIKYRGHDGGLEGFYEYVKFPLSFGICFDFIFIDGRARYECSKIAFELSHKNTLIFFHDFNNPPNKSRENYIKCLDFFELIDKKDELALFRIK